jgi:hypothetical protein
MMKGLMFTVCAHVFHSACLDELIEKGREAGQSGLNCPFPYLCAHQYAAMLSDAATGGFAARTSLT